MFQPKIKLTACKSKNTVTYNFKFKHSRQNAENGEGNENLRKVRLCVYVAAMGNKNEKMERRKTVRMTYKLYKEKIFLKFK